MGVVTDIRGNLSMAGKLDEISRVIGKVETHTEAILRDVAQLKSDMTASIDAAKWVETEGKPAVKAMKRAKHIAMGALGVAGLGSSPSWMPKVAAIFHAILP